MRLLAIVAKLFWNGGWAPLVVFAAHVVLHRVAGLYAVWPSADVPMHFFGGVSIAYFVSTCFRALPRAEVSAGRANGSFIQIRAPLLR